MPIFAVNSLCVNGLLANICNRRSSSHLLKARLNPDSTRQQRGEGRIMADRIMMEGHKEARKGTKKDDSLAHASGCNSYWSAEERRRGRLTGRKMGAGRWEGVST